MPDERQRYRPAVRIKRHPSSSISYHLAPGWWILGIIIIVLIWYALKLWLNYRLRVAPVREFRKQLFALDIGNPKDGKIKLVKEMSNLVRQFAIYQFGRKNVAHLFGEDWLRFLDHTTSGIIKFSSGVGIVFGDEQYRQQMDVNLFELRQLLIGWSEKI